MADNLDSTSISLTKKTVDFLYKGLVVFYPESIFGSKEGKKRAIANSWGGYKRSEFLQLLWNTTETEDIEIAAKIVLGWKKVIEKGVPPEKTIPAELDSLLSQLDENVTGKKKLSPYETQQLAKKSLHVSEKIAEKPTTDIPPKAAVGVSTAEAVSKAAGPLSVFTGRIMTLPFRAATYFSGPTVHSSKAEGEGSGVATARYMLSHDIQSSSLLSLESEAQKVGITSNQLRKLVELIKIEEKAHPFANKWIAIVYSSRRAQITQAQIVSLLTPSSDRTMAVLPRKSLLGNLFGRVGQQVFGKVTSKILKTAGKKVAEKAVTAVATKAAAQAAVTAIAPGIGNLLLAAGQAILGKIKDFISSLKGKEGKENVLALISGSMVLGGLFIGGPVGGILVLGGTIPALGLLTSKAGGLRPLGTNIGSYGQAFIAGLTNVVLPAIGAPLIIALISISVLIAIIIFIINSGAYIVPLSPTQVPGAIVSPYIGIEKTASPTKINKISGTETITYHVRIFAKKGALTNINISNKYKVISESSPPVPNPDVPEISDPPETISPVSDYEFDYSISLTAEHNDSIVVDTLTVTAQAEGEEAEARQSASVVIGNPPMHCPVPGGSQFDGSYTPGDETKGHGSNDYWDRMRQSNCAYSIPQNSGCSGPSQPAASENVCFDEPNTCSFYGYALDIFPTGSREVFLPTIDGKTVTWNYFSSFQNRSNGWTYIYKSGNYVLVLTHLKAGANTGSNIPSREKIGELFPQGKNTHLHLEFSANGQYQRPEEFFCF